MNSINLYTQTQITFLDSVYNKKTKKNFKIGFPFHFFAVNAGLYSIELSPMALYQFLEILDGNIAYIVSPALIVRHGDSYPVIQLGKKFLVTRNSNIKLLSSYLTEQITNITDLYFDDQNIRIILKYRPLIFLNTNTIKIT